MKQSFEIIRKTRAHLIDLTKDLSIEQFNKIPEGFVNNIMWNLGHILVAQVSICYRRSGLDMWIPEELAEAYKPGSKPERSGTGEELEEIRQLLLSSVDRLETDYEKGLFQQYAPWTTRYGVELKRIEDAINFLQFHEGLHTGYVMALKRAVRISQAISTKQ